MNKEVGESPVYLFPPRTESFFDAYREVALNLYQKRDGSAFCTEQARIEQEREGTHSYLRQFKLLRTHEGITERQFEELYRPGFYTATRALWNESDATEIPEYDLDRRDAALYFSDLTDIRQSPEDQKLLEGLEVDQDVPLMPSDFVALLSDSFKREMLSHTRRRIGENTLAKMTIANTANPDIHAIIHDASGILGEDAMVFSLGITDAYWGMHAHLQIRRLFGMFVPNNSAQVLY